MYLRIEQIKEEGLSLEFEEGYEMFPVLNEMVELEECKFMTPIKTALRAIRIGDMIEISGEINIRVCLPCARCLQDYEKPLKSRFELTYLQRLPDTQQDEEQEEVEISAEDTGLIYFQGEEINLQDGIQEQVVLALPIKAICKDDCKGLCASCGKDLNEGDCGCDRQPSSNKFAALKNLKLNK